MIFKRACFVNKSGEFCAWDDPDVAFSLGGKGGFMHDAEAKRQGVLGHPDYDASKPDGKDSKQLDPVTPPMRFMAGHENMGEDKQTDAKAETKPENKAVSGPPENKSGSGLTINKAEKQS
jgi:hypothetical protein